MSISGKTANLTPARHPLVSILIHSYEREKLAGCLDSILASDLSDEFEIVICDNATTDGSWEIANEYMQKCPSQIVLSRNQVSLGPEWNLNKSVKMATGKYYAELVRDRQFDEAYIRKIISQLESDPLFIHSYIGITKEHHSHPPVYKPSPELKRNDNPLVSVCIHNYNYGRYLEQCLESVARQTYKNIEICFSDNASTDNSWQIALDFSRRHSIKMNLSRNRMNLGPGRNQTNCFINMRGKYMLMLCSDDAIRPDFVERCITLLERNPDAAFAMVHRDLLDENGQVTSEPPFYNGTCVIPGEEQAAVYMMASVNPSVSQILYKHEKFMGRAPSGVLNDRWFGARFLDFAICCEYPIIYIHEPLLLNRIHNGSEGASIDGNLIQCIGQYVLAYQFAEIATNFGLTKAAGRLDAAVEKVGKLCLRYCIRLLLGDNELTALRYFHLAQATFPRVVEDETFRRLQDYWQQADTDSRAEILTELRNQMNLSVRSTSYPPPPGSIPC